MSKTVNRGWLKREVAKGNMMVRCCYHMTDDYARDYADNYGKTDWIKVGIKEQHNGEEETYDIPEWYFKSQSGCAYQDDKGKINLIIHSNLAYELKKVM